MNRWYKGYVNKKRTPDENKKFKEFREFTPINNDTFLDPSLHSVIMSYISQDVNLKINLDDFLPLGKPYSEVISSHNTLLGGIEIRGKLSTNDNKLVGLVNINISQTINYSISNTGNISSWYINIAATKVNDKFDGRYIIKYITTEIDGDGYPDIDYHIEEIDYRNGIIDGEHTIIDRDREGYNMIGTIGYDNGRVVEPYDTTVLMRPEPPHFLQPYFGS